MRAPNLYSSSPIDRAAATRRDPARLQAWLELRDSWVLPLWQAKSFITGPRDAPVMATVSPLEPWLYEAVRAEAHFLGLVQERPVFAVDLSHIADPKAHPELSARGAFVDLRTVAPLMPAEEIGLLAYARGLVWWHARHRFCGVCGAPTQSAEGGHVRRCTAEPCGTTHFPRTDPAVIMLVHDGDRCLLGRNPRLPPGMHSTLAGFVEPGESLEDAVIREVREETGVTCTDVRYHSSQPWPFPASIMLGFHARAVTTAITVDQDELESAAWYEKGFLRTHVDDDSFRLPRADSIARRLIQEWLDGTA